MELKDLKSLLRKPVDGGSLALMRIAVGLVMMLEAYTLFHPSQSTNGEAPLKAFYTGADIHITFPYQAFDWLPLLKPHGIYWIVGIMAAGGLLMAIGLFYRAAATAVFLTWGYLYAVEATRTYWMSYYYVELLLTFLLIWMPAASKYSIDAWLARHRNPEGIIPFWPIFLLRAQLVITYFYAGIAKLNSDWLVHAEPVRYFLSKSNLLIELGPRLSPDHLRMLKSVLQNDDLAYFLSYTGAAFDLSVGFLLLARRTRILGIVLMLIFHTTNHFILFEDLEWFPLVGLVTSLIFLDPDWPHRLWNWLHKPRIAKPDLAWLGLGAVLLPVVGGALGWKLAPSPRVGAKRELPISRWTLAFVACWLTWQVLMPLRHYFIQGDGRFTWEGLSFSWRLKAEVYRSAPCSVTINDPSILATEESGVTKINWVNWRGDKVIYRSITPSPSGWQKLPEIMVILEPQTGERVIYNPCSGVAGWRSEADSRARVQAIWQEVYGRQPQAVLRTFPFNAVLSSYANILHSKGQATGNPNDPAWLVDLIKKHGSDGDGQILPPLRRATPFGTQVETPAAMPFLVVDDEALYHPALTNAARLDRKAWVSSVYTQLPGSSNSGQTTVTNEPLVIYAADIRIETKDFLPQSFLCDSVDSPYRPVSISWNYLKELSMSEGMHVSMQPFFLRRYARHVASLWEKEYGRRPMVNVDTQVSLNGRPFQRLVDPHADLASVPAKWLEHNWWIRDLEMPDIQNDGLVPSAPRR